jgi:NAD(P)-dependent dehydrogenase (short-subunit alcohol dehydrogenase family)
MDDRVFAGEAALVTGAGVRLGRAIALRLGELGAHVIVHHNRSAKPAATVCKEILKSGGKATAVAADLSKPAEAAALIGQAKRIAGKPVRFLVNNASDFPATRLEDLEWRELEETLRLDAWAPFELARQFARELPKPTKAKAGAGQIRQGAVVNLLDARIADYDWSHAGYHLAKRMLADMTQLLAVQLAPAVTVNGVAPGPILPPPGEGDDVLTRWAKHLPLQRTPTPEDIADATAFLLASSSTTGQVLYVDGGRHLGKGVFA